MFKAIRIDGNDIQDEEFYSENLGKTIEFNNIAIKKLLKSLQYNDRRDVEEIVQKHFPTKDLNVFISHSHEDEKKAIAIANMLSINSSLKIKCFIDSLYWNYVDKLLNKAIKEEAMLLKEIKGDTNIRKNEKLLLNVMKKDIQGNNINVKTGIIEKDYRFILSNFYMILGSQLTKMINQCDLFIFLETDNSIKELENNIYTKSSWIFHELNIVNTIERKKTTSNPVIKRIAKEADIHISLADLNTPFLYNINNLLKEISKLTYKELENIILSSDIDAY